MVMRIKGIVRIIKASHLDGDEGGLLIKLRCEALASPLYYVEYNRSHRSNRSQSEPQGANSETGKIRWLGRVLVKVFMLQQWKVERC